MKKALFLLALLLLVGVGSAGADTSRLNDNVFMGFPVAPGHAYSYINDWGYSRAGNPSGHQGNDIFGAKGTPLVAVEDGVITSWFGASGLGGYRLHIRDDQGIDYYYAHLNNDSPGTDDGLGGAATAYAPGIGPGVRVERGQVIAYMGDSGDAENTPPHLHFGITVNGQWINPYPYLQRAEFGFEPTFVTRTIKPGRRREIDLNNYVYRKSFGARVTANGPVVAERTMYFNGAGRSGASTTRGAPKAGRVWYLAEGSTDPGFETWLLLSNPTGRTTQARVTYMTETGSTDGGKVRVPAYGRASVPVNQVLPNKRFGIKVVSGRNIVAERSVYFNYGRFDGGHTAVGTTAPARQWHFADGGTTAGTETWLALLNPGVTPATVRLKYLTANGEIDGGTVIVPPRRRRSVSVNAAVIDSDLAVVVASDQPIAAEKVSYSESGANTGGSVSSGAKSPKMRWFFAEGDTRSGRQEYLTLFNPQTSAVPVRVKYRFESGPSVTRSRMIPANSQLKLFVNDASEVGPGRKPAVRIDAAAPITVERRLVFDLYDHKGVDTGTGSPAASKRWYFAEGSTGKGFSNRLVVFNPTRSPVKVRIRLLK